MKKIVGVLLSVLLVLNVTLFVRADTNTSSQTQPESKSGSYVNPIYADKDVNIVTQDNDAVPRYKSSNIIYEDIDSAAAYFRSELVNRSSTISFKYKYLKSLYDDHVIEFSKQLYQKAIEETDDLQGNTGDYIRYHFDGYRIGVSGSSNSDPDYWTVTFTYTVNYLSDSSMESQVTEKLQTVYSQLGLSTKDDYEKIKAIHDYISGNVKYDQSLTRYSAYNALIGKSSVCQGYASLFYRMCKDNGLKVRIITGDNHAWNIIKLGDYYYYIDCTWDSQTTVIYKYFLKNYYDINVEKGHTREPEFETNDFYGKYPTYQISYNATSDLGLTTKDAPSSISFSKSDGKNKITFTSVNGATKYKIYRAEQDSDVFGTVGITESTSFVDEYAESNKIYTYKVAVVDNYGHGKFSDTVTSFTSTILVDSEKKTISNINVGSKIQDITEGVRVANNASSVVFTDASGNTVSNTETVKTGMKVKINGSNSNIYSIVIYGDVNGDGKININDIESVQKVILGKITLNGCYKQAGLIVSTDSPGIYDLEAIQKEVLGKQKIDQNK